MRDRFCASLVQASRSCSLRASAPLLLQQARTAPCSPSPLALQPSVTHLAVSQQQYLYMRRPRSTVAVVNSSAAASAPAPGGRRFPSKRDTWTAIGVACMLGSIAGAAAALMGGVWPVYALLLPLVLPVVSLVAALRRDGLAGEVRLRLLRLLLNLSRI